VEPSRRPPCLRRSNPRAARLTVEPSRRPPCEATPRNLRAHAPPPHFRPMPSPAALHCGHQLADTNLGTPSGAPLHGPTPRQVVPLRNGGTPAKPPPGATLVRHDLTCRAAHLPTAPPTLVRRTSAPQRGHFTTFVRRISSDGTAAPHSSL